jgi:hypothetical protein
MSFGPPANNTNALLHVESESLREFLLRRQRELQHQVAALRGQIVPKERELAEIDIAIKALPPAPPAASGAAGPSLADLYAAAPSLANHGTSYATPLALSRAAIDLGLYQYRTIKELAVQSLLDHFKNGATVTQIRDFIRDAYGRTIELSSLRPQLHRLKSDTILVFGPGDLWNLTAKARHLYMMYDHPTSRAAMKELQDDPNTTE